MSTGRLTEVRELIRARQGMVERVATILESVVSRPTMAGVVIRCTATHRGKGGSPALARAFPVGATEFLVISKMERLPSDQLNLRQWEEEHLLGMGADPHWMTDDDALESFLEHVECWRVGSLPEGERWLRKEGPMTIRTIVTAGAVPVITPWVRCPRHPDGAEVLTVNQLRWPAYP